MLLYLSLCVEHREFKVTLTKSGGCLATCKGFGQPKLDRWWPDIRRPAATDKPDTSDVVGLRQEQLSLSTIPTNLHSKYVSCRTEVLHGKLQSQFPNEFDELSGMPTGE